MTISVGESGGEAFGSLAGYAVARGLGISWEQILGGYERHIRKASPSVSGSRDFDATLPPG
jgi:hypothetical protein